MSDEKGDDAYTRFRGEYPLPENRTTLKIDEAQARVEKQRTNAAIAQAVGLALHMVGHRQVSFTQQDIENFEKLYQVDFKWHKDIATMTEHFKITVEPRQ